MLHGETHYMGRSLQEPDHHTHMVLSQSAVTKLEAQLYKMSLYAVRILFPFAGTKTPQPTLV